MIIIGASLDLGPTPPYTVAQDLRQALRDNQEGQAYCNGFGEQLLSFRNHFQVFF